MDFIKFYLVHSNNAFLNSVIVNRFGERLSMRELRSFFAEAGHLIPSGATDSCRLVCEFNGHSEGKVVKVSSTFDGDTDENLELQIEGMIERITKKSIDFGSYSFNENLAYLI